MKRFTIALGLLSPALWALESFEARFALRIRGVNAGEMRLRAQLQPDHYRLQAKTSPSLPARMLGYGEIQEWAEGRIKDGQLRPKHYQRRMQGDDEYMLRYDYHLSEQRISGQHGEKSFELHYESLIPLDILSLIIQTLSDEERRQPAERYALLSEEKIRSYQVEALPPEKWQDSRGKMVPVQVYRQSNGHRRTMIYFAAAPLRLAQLQQIRNDDIIFVLKLIEYRPLNP